MRFGWLINVTKTRMPVGPEISDALSSEPWLLSAGASSKLK